MGKFNDYLQRAIVGKENITKVKPEEAVKYAKLLLKIGRAPNREMIDKFKKEHGLSEADMRPILMKLNQLVRQ